MSSRESVYLPSEQIPESGPARLLLGGADAAIAALSPMTYHAVRLAPGERWTSRPAAGHNVGWAAVSRGAIFTPEIAQAGELVIFATGLSKSCPTRGRSSWRARRRRTGVTSCSATIQCAPRRGPRRRRGLRHLVQRARLRRSRDLLV